MCQRSTNKLWSVLCCLARSPLIDSRANEEVIMSRLELKNTYLHVIVDPDHGAEIIHLSLASGTNSGVNVLSAPEWTTPLPASHSRTYGNDVLDWLSEYRG